MGEKIITICGEVYSDNLGDGVIAKSLKEIFLSINPSIEVRLLDLSGRLPLKKTNEKLLNRTSKFRRRIKEIHHYLLLKNNSYEKFANVFSWCIKRRNMLYNSWTAGIRQSSLLIIGGGHLLQDNNLNFPLKIFGITQLASKYKIPVAFYACGVGKKKWSALASYLFKTALTNPGVVSISVRDEESKRLLIERIPELNGRNVEVTPDPAILAAKVLGIFPQRNVKTIGLGIMSPAKIRKVSREWAKIDDNAMIRFWVETAECLRKNGYFIKIFTNGEEGDHNFAQIVANKLKGDQVNLLVRPRTPKDLVEIIASFRAIVAFRLHAHIIAFSLGIPSIGLIWDDKVRQFAKVVHRDRFFLEQPEVTPTRVLERLEEALLCRVDDVQIEEIKNKILTTAERLLHLTT